MDNLQTFQLLERRDCEQYFFTKKTACELADLAKGRTVCLCTPTVGEILIKNKARRDVWVFDSDLRLATNFPKGKFFLYDLQRGLHSHANDPKTKDMNSRFLHWFNTIIFDPPFSTDIALVVKNINAFLSWGNGDNSVYVAYPRAGLEKLEELLLPHNICGQEHPNIEIEYINPPERYANGSKKKISLLWFKRV